MITSKRWPTSLPFTMISGCAIIPSISIGTWDAPMFACCNYVLTCFTPNKRVNLWIINCFFFRHCATIVLTGWDVSLPDVISPYEAHFALFTYFSECDLLILVDKMVSVHVMYYKKASSLYKLGEYSEAVALYYKAIELNRSFWNNYTWCVCSGRNCCIKI
jgi:tetratricopeptide repeat protein